ncbi:MAG TPA: pyridoxamine 5'-phosphate oxidase [Alphaproteobacteria bacterium]|nr:pyridoxamine 5'-phosphate oxidase [Alphaproteobacteria bacterium]
MSETYNPISGNDPFALFQQWFAEAQQKEINDPNAMSLATADESGISVRIVLLKGLDARGFTFYTNTQSRKGKQLKAHAKAGLCFHWKSLRRQVRVEGLIEPVTEDEADAYFRTRPRGSQIGAWASLQSENLESRAALEARLREFEKKFEGQDVPRPPHWSGFRLLPEMIEFWQDMPHRLHDRLIFRKEGKAWAQGRVYP